MAYPLSKSGTAVFVEQSLALLGSANYDILEIRKEDSLFYFYFYFLLFFLDLKIRKIQCRNPKLCLRHHLKKKTAKIIFSMKEFLVGHIFFLTL